MKRTFVLAPAFVIIGAWILGCCDPDPDPEPPVAIGEKHIFHTIVNGDQREYIVYIPSHYNPANSYPIVFQLHGGTGNGEKFYRISGWNDLAEAHGFLVAYPTSWAYDLNSNGCGNRPVTSWNDFELIDEVCPAEVLRDDVAFISQMIDEIDGNFSIDTNRVYISGFSNGGGMTSRLSIELSNRIAAVGIMAGSLPGDTTATFTPARILPIHVMIGTVDDKVGEVTSFPNGLPMDLPAVIAEPHINNLLTTWATAFDLNMNYIITDSIGSVITAQFNGNSGAPDHLLRFSLLENVEHAFPNPPNRPGAADIFWQFFEPYSLH